MTVAAYIKFIDVIIFSMVKQLHKCLIKERNPKYLYNLISWTDNYNVVLYNSCGTVRNDSKLNLNPDCIFSGSLKRFFISVIIFIWKTAQSAIYSWKQNNLFFFYIYVSQISKWSSNFNIIILDSSKIFWVIKYRNKSLKSYKIIVNDNLRTFIAFRIFKISILTILFARITIYVEFFVTLCRLV